MAALAQEFLKSYDAWTRHQLPLATTHKAFKGGSCFADPATQTVSNVPGAGKIFVGIFAETIDNVAGGAPVPVNVDFLFERLVLWRDNDGTISAANLFSPCFHLDDHTLELAGTTPAGLILAVDPVQGVLFAVKGL
jgi:hypothetical protein